MPQPASEIEKTTALAYVLTNGNPPKSLQYDDETDMFRFRDAKAALYRYGLEKALRNLLLEDHNTRAKLARGRNRCLRYILGKDNGDKT